MSREIGAGCGNPGLHARRTIFQPGEFLSSARVALVAFRRRIEAWQDHFAFQSLRPTYRRWLTVEILAGRINAPLTEATLRHKWIAPKSAYLDPLKDAQSEALGHWRRAHSRREAVAARGLNIEELDAEIAADRAREKALGINFAPPAATPSKGPKMYLHLRSAVAEILTREAALGAQSWNPEAAHLRSCRLVRRRRRAAGRARALHRADRRQPRLERSARRARPQFPSARRHKKHFRLRHGGPRGRRRGCRYRPHVH